MRLVCMECNHIFENEEEVLSYDDDDLSCSSDITMFAIILYLINILQNKKGEFLPL